jgi:hypothetical protein
MSILVFPKNVALKSVVWFCGKGFAEAWQFKERLQLYGQILQSLKQ